MNEKIKDVIGAIFELTIILTILCAVGFGIVKIGGDYFNSIKFKTNYTSVLEIPKELDSLAGSKMPVEEFKEKFLR